MSTENYPGFRLAFERGQIQRELGRRTILKGGQKDVLGQEVSERGRKTVGVKRNTGACTKIFDGREKNGPKFGEAPQGC